MKKELKNLILFCSSFLFGIIFYRLLILFFYTDRVSPLRSLTGLSIHHFHYGIILITIAILMFIFYKKNGVSILFAGIGLGLILDTFVPSLLINYPRALEITAYNQSLIGTIIISGLIIGISILLCKFPTTFIK